VFAAGLAQNAPAAPGALPSARGAAEAGAPDGPFWAARPDTATFEKIQAERLAAAQKTLDRLLAVRGERTVENTLKPYDDVLVQLNAAGYQSNLIANVHPDDALRAAAERSMQKVQAFATELSLNRGLYDALTKVDLKGADEQTRFFVESTLLDFRLAGVDKDEATRAKIRALRDELVQVGQEFSRNIRGDVRTVTVDSAAELAGLPPDYVARKKPGPDGKITLTTEYPDAVPVFSYAKSEELRKRLYMEYNNRAFPKNEAVLQRLIARRHELATLAGFPSWADYITADKMVGSAKNAGNFIDRVVAASGPKAEREYKELLERKRQDVPGADTVNAWESAYYSELVRKSSYDFDSQAVRPYFPYQRVKQGVLDVSSKLFGVTFREVKDAPVWHPSVECWEMFEGGKLVGRFYLDMHPRPNKYNHAAHFAIRTGVAGRQIPESALVCNVPGGTEGDPGLLEHSDVETVFHEFGHLLHALFAGRNKWIGVGGVATERDFVEAPSQMLEEWIWDPSTLATFARHYQTDEPIPADLVRQMRRASEFGKALGVRRQMVYAKLSLSAYDRSPADVNLEAMAKGLTKQYQPFPYVDGTHFYTAFGHLDGYSAVYYTYMWSLVIAKDLFSRFDRTNMLGGDVAMEYRRKILAPGGSKPAAELVKDFLGRPFNFKAWETWLNEDA
jgi:thimet oligopeptidase